MKHHSRALWEKNDNTKRIPFIPHLKGQLHQKLLLHHIVFLSFLPSLSGFLSGRGTMQRGLCEHLVYNWHTFLGVLKVCLFFKLPSTKHGPFNLLGTIPLTARGKGKVLQSSKVRYRFGKHLQGFASPTEILMDFLVDPFVWLSLVMIDKSWTVTKMCYCRSVKVKSSSCGEIWEYPLGPTLLRKSNLCPQFLDEGVGWFPPRQFPGKWPKTELALVSIHLGLPRQSFWFSDSIP